MGFSKKAASNAGSGSSNFDAEAYATWHTYIFEECFKGKVEDKGNGKLRKKKVLPAVLNFIMGLGTPVGGVALWDTKVALPVGDEEYSDEEIEYMKTHEGSDFVWDKEWDNEAKQMVKARKQSSPAIPAEEYGLCVDIPSILVDYAKHPNAKEGAPEDKRPLRISLNGVFMRELQRVIKFEVNYKSGEVSDNNLIRQIAAAAGVEQELRDSGWDIGEVAQAVCNFQVTMDLTNKEDKTFFNVSASKPTPIEDMYNPMDEDQLIASADSIKAKALACEGLSPFTGILLDMDMEEYTDDLLKMVGSDVYAFVARAEKSETYTISGVSAKTQEEYSFEKGFDYKGCNFQIAYDKWKAKVASGKGDDKKASAKKAASKPQPQPEPKKEAKPVEDETDYNESPMDFDDNIPF